MTLLRILGGLCLFVLAAFVAVVTATVLVMVDGCAHPAPTVVTAPALHDACAALRAVVCARVSGCPGWSGYDGGSCEQGCAALGDNYPEGTAIAACLANIAPGDCAAAEACKTGGGP